jgi:immune inhibitor A
MRYKTLITLVAVLMLLIMVTPALANPPFPEGAELPVTLRPPEDVTPRPAVRRAKPIDQPNIKDYLRNRRRQELMEASRMAEVQALDLTGTDRVLVILVEFAGSDVFVWEEEVSTWDPLGIADPNEAVYDEDDNLIVGDCSNIITQTTVFTYTAPLHNEIPRPLSPDDHSADSIWTEDFSPEWFDGFMFGEGVVFDYTMQDGTPVFEDFSGQSVRDYYEDLSDGMYTITGDVIGWVQVPHSTWWYGADQCPGARSGGGSWNGAIPGAGNAHTLVTDALDAVNAISDTIPGFDWANYDLDSDGIIDRLWIVHAGYGEEDSTTLLNRTGYGEASLWSHSSSLSPPYKVAPGISAGPYIMMPENGGIGVFAHEYGHNLGADDLYAYGYGETSAGFWTLMADDWTGYPIGFEPPAVDPWHLDNWGWLDPYVITDPTQVYEVTLGQASRFPGGEDVYRGAKIVLPDGVLNHPVPVWQGDSYWWGGKQDLANAMMTTVDPIAIPAAGATLSFDLVYDIEDEWDFLWIQVSEDSVTWNVEDTLTNENTQCEHDPDWIGGLYGFPEDLCGAGLGGFYGYNANWPDPEVQVFDLSAYAGQSIYLRFWCMTDWDVLYSGAFVDNVEVTADSTVLFFDDAESGDANWDYQHPWVRSDGTQSFTHNFYLQWRNVNENGGYDSALGESRWRFGPANTGLLVWYNSNLYGDNEIYTYLEDDYGFGPKGRMLVVDSHPEPYRDPNIEPSWLGREHTNITTRSQMRDAPFTLQDTVDFTYGAVEFEGRPAVSSFHDSLGYYPGVADEGDGTYWSTVDWDASVALPATGRYSVAGGSAYPGIHIQYLEGAGWYGFWEAGAGGTGNPGDDGVQYGWHVELIEEAADHTWGRVRIYNDQSAPTISEVEVTNVRDTSFTVSWITDIPSDGHVNYGTDSANLDQTAYDDRGAETSDDTHYVELLGLTPETTYYFDVVSDGTVDDNNGDHYSVTTGPTLDLPSSDTIYGQVFKEDGTTPAEGTIVYITLKDNDGLGSSNQAAKMSSLVDSNGYWTTNLGNARLADLSAYFEYSASGDSVMLLAKGAAEGCARQTVDTSADYPAADMILSGCYLPGDLDCDGEVNIDDVMMVASRWRTSCEMPDPDNNPETPNYDPLYDIDDNCIINVVDIMLVVKHWGETCP